jgi:hypothetical protein
VKAWIRWAEDQSGCQPRIDFPVSDNCAASFISVQLNCDLWAEGADESPGMFGGGFISDSQWGCLEFGIVRDSRD